KRNCFPRDAEGVVQPLELISNQCPAVRKIRSEMSVPVHHLTPWTLPASSPDCSVDEKLAFHWIWPVEGCHWLTSSCDGPKSPLYKLAGCVSSLGTHCDSSKAARWRSQPNASCTALTGSGSRTGSVAASVGACATARVFWRSISFTRSCALLSLSRIVCSVRAFSSGDLPGSNLRFSRAASDPAGGGGSGIAGLSASPVICAAACV